MIVRYNQLNEAIIKVPQEILQKVNTYVASYLCFKINQFISKIDFFMPSTTSPEEKQRVINDAKQAVGKLQKQYGAKNISALTANNILNKSIAIPFDVESFFQQLNFKGANPGMIALLKNRLKLSLMIKSDANGIGGSLENTSNYSVLVTIVTKSLGPKPSFLDTASQIMSNTYHEMQHAVQSMALSFINKNDKQLKMNDDYGHEWDKTDYYSSGIEYTPQLGNVIDLVQLELEKSALKDALNPEKNKAINSAINKAIQDSNTSRKFLTVLYQKDHEQYKKALSAVYKYVSPFYDNLKQNGIDFSTTDLPEEELEASVDVMLSVYKMMYKVEAYDTTALGSSKDDIQQLTIRSDKNKWIIDLIKNNFSKNMYQFKIRSADPEFEDSESLSSKQVLNLFGILSDITFKDAADIIDELEFITDSRKEVNDENINDVIHSLHDDAQHLEVPFKISDNLTFSTMGKTFRIEKIEDTQFKVDIHFDNKTLYSWTLKQILVAFQMMIRFYISYPDEVTQILDNDNMYVEFMTDLRNI
jgi:ribosomal protein S20